MENETETGYQNLRYQEIKSSFECWCIPYEKGEPLLGNVCTSSILEVDPPITDGVGSTQLSYFPVEQYIYMDIPKGFDMSKKK